ncbi:MAG: sulfatase-like hydrolase/transferase [Bacteroidetes bacterium]|nr:sulfatase-like hydrolase/transferase [Bacteroidota bacterium]
MKKLFSLFIRQLVFWIVLFNFTRLVFLLYYSGILSAEGIKVTEASEVFIHAFQLDLATACYFMVFPFLLLLLQSFWSPAWLNIINKVYSGFMIFVYTLSAAGEMGIYAEWKTKLTYKIIKYFSHPSEIYNSAETGTFLLLILLFTMMFAAGFFSYLRWFYRDFSRERVPFWHSLIFAVITPPLLFVGLRGGVQQIPINQSQSYFSGHNILNLAAVNNAFNLYISIFENLGNIRENPFRFMDNSKSAGIMRDLYSVTKDTTVSVLSTSRPNIVLLIMESWSADLIYELGGEAGITPRFSKLAKEGILFNSMYASGSRSEQGMACIFGGFPAHPISSITVQPDKFVKLPSLVSEMKKLNYSTAFYFGGQLIYGNIKSYIIFNGFDQIMEGENFPSSIPRGKLGIHDEFSLGYMVNDLEKFRQPFFVSLFTVSTHSPWDQPFEKPLKWGGNEQEYINAAYYTDHCLGEFIDKARKKPWYPNTLFIVVADHSHNSYRNWHPESREYHKIPLLMFGDVIKPEFRGSVVSKLGNQHDLAATILSQMGLPHQSFKYSKDLFNPYSGEFAYYTTEDGAGWLHGSSYYTFETHPYIGYKWSSFSPATDSTKIINEAKAYLQEVFGNYLKD